MQEREELLHRALTVFVAAQVEIADQGFWQRAGFYILQPELLPPDEWAGFVNEAYKPKVEELRKQGLISTEVEANAAIEEVVDEVMQRGTTVYLTGFAVRSAQNLFPRKRK